MKTTEHKVKIDDHVTLTINIPEEMDLVEFRGLTTKLNKMINIKEVEESIGQKLTRKYVKTSNRRAYIMDKKQRKQIIKEYDAAKNKAEYAESKGTNLSALNNKIKYWRKTK